jgi:hypothetical protein
VRLAHGAKFEQGRWRSIYTSQIQDVEMQDSNSTTNKREEKVVALIPLRLEEQARNDVK